MGFGVLALELLNSFGSIITPFLSEVSYCTELSLALHSSSHTQEQSIDYAKLPKGIDHS